MMKCSLLNTSRLDILDLISICFNSYDAEDVTYREMYNEHVYTNGNHLITGELMNIEDHYLDYNFIMNEIFTLNKADIFSSKIIARALIENFDYIKRVSTKYTNYQSLIDINKDIKNSKCSYPTFYQSVIKEMYDYIIENNESFMCYIYEVEMEKYKALNYNPFDSQTALIKYVYQVPESLFALLSLQKNLRGDEDGNIDLECDKK